MKQKELIEKIVQWAKDRNLILGSTPQKQFIKLMEEFGELCAGIARNDKEKIKDSIGDCFVVMVILNKQTNSNFDFTPLPYLARKGVDVWIEKCVARFASISEKINYTGKANRHLEYDFAYALYCLIKISNEYGLTLESCVQVAWDEIKDRKGKMIDGVFVKEEDL